VLFTWTELVQNRSSNSLALQGLKEETRHFKALKYVAPVPLLCSTESSGLWTHTCRISSSVRSAVFKKMLAGTQSKVHLFNLVSIHLQSNI